MSYLPFSPIFCRAVGRPDQPLARGAPSGSNPHSSHSALRGRERQLSFLTNAYSVHNPVILLSPELPVSEKQVQRTGMLRSGRWRPHKIDQMLIAPSFLDTQGVLMMVSTAIFMR